MRFIIYKHLLYVTLKFVVMTLTFYVINADYKASSQIVINMYVAKAKEITVKHSFYMMSTVKSRLKEIQIDNAI